VFSLWSYATLPTRLGMLFWDIELANNAVDPMVDVQALIVPGRMLRLPHTRSATIQYVSIDGK
jgi:hypothetical protein